MIINNDLILKKLNESNLSLYNVEPDTIEDVKKSYQETTGNIPFLYPNDEFFVMNCCGDVVHIGNIYTLQSFAVNYSTVTIK